MFDFTPQHVRQDGTHQITALCCVQHGFQAGLNIVDPSEQGISGWQAIAPRDLPPTE